MCSSKSMCSFNRKLFPLKVRATSKTTSPTMNPRSMGSILTWPKGTHSRLKYAVYSTVSPSCILFLPDSVSIRRNALPQAASPSFR